MYKQFVQNLEIDVRKLRFTRYDFLNVQWQNICKHCCQNHIFTDEYTIWHLEDDGRLYFLGFIKCVSHSVAYSKYFSTKVYNSWERGGAEPNQMAQQKAYQIVEWELDIALMEKNTLVDVFTKLALKLCDAKNQILLWMDGPNDLLVYPIPIDYRKRFSYALGAYYADYFLTLLDGMGDYQIIFHFDEGDPLVEVLAKRDDFVAIPQQLLEYETYRKLANTGYYYRKDKANNAPGQQRHVHVFIDRNGEHQIMAINMDGTPHDGSKLQIPKKLIAPLRALGVNVPDDGLLEYEDSKYIADDRTLMCD